MSLTTIYKFLKFISISLLHDHNIIRIKKYVLADFYITYIQRSFSGHINKHVP